MVNCGGVRVIKPCCYGKIINASCQDVSHHLKKKAVNYSLDQNDLHLLDLVNVRIDPNPQTG